MPSVHWRHAATWNWQNWPRHRTVRHVELRLQPAHRKRGRSPSCLVYLIGEILEYFGRWVAFAMCYSKRYVSKFYWTFGHLLFGDGHSHLDDGNTMTSIPTATDVCAFQANKPKASQAKSPRNQQTNRHKDEDRNQIKDRNKKIQKDNYY